MEEKKCPACKKSLPLSDFSTRKSTGRPFGRCIPCMRAYHTAWYHSPKNWKKRRDKRRSPDQWKRDRAAYYQRTYGLSLEDRERMQRAQNGRCGLCFRQRTLNVDHDHSTGRVRALLCSACNRGLGLLGDSPDLLNRAAEYVIRWKSP